MPIRFVKESDQKDKCRTAQCISVVSSASWNRICMQTVTITVLTKIFSKSLTTFPRFGDATSSTHHIQPTLRAGNSDVSKGLGPQCLAIRTHYSTRFDQPSEQTRISWKIEFVCVLEGTQMQRRCTANSCESSATHQLRKQRNALAPSVIRARLDPTCFFDRTLGECVSTCIIICAHRFVMRAL